MRSFKGNNLFSNRVEKPRHRAFTLQQDTYRYKCIIVVNIKHLQNTDGLKSLKAEAVAKNVLIFFNRIKNKNPHSSNISNALKHSSLILGKNKIKKGRGRRKYKKINILVN